MSAAMLFDVWIDTLVTTALLVLAILLIRKPFARFFGPKLTYTLWLIPALRLVLPPLPFADPVVPAAPVAMPVTEIVWPDAAQLGALDGAAAASSAAPLWSLAELLPWLFAAWAVGMVAVIVAAMLAHDRFRRAVLGASVELEPIGSIRLVMSDAVDGPIAFGLWRRFVAVPQDFFARYAADERALAVDHELAHHRHGDLWANAAALVLLATQWFNPFAWRAIRAFRFDQEAACDARVLTMADSSPRAVRTVRYAHAIAKAAVGSRLSLAAPMAVHDNLQERLTMLMREDVSIKRGAMGRLLVGGAAVAVLATTATLVPSGIASANAQYADAPEPPAPPAPPAAPTDVPQPPAPPAAPEAPAAPGVHRVMIVTTDDDAKGADGGKKREIHRVVIRDGERKGGGEHGLHWAPEAPASGRAKRFEFALPGAPTRDEILSALKEQGVTGKKANAIADQLEAKGKRSIALAPMPPMPPIPPMPPAAWSSADGKGFAFAKCGKGAKAMPVIEFEEQQGGKKSRVVMTHCGPEGDRTAQVSALKKARERFASGESSGKLSDEIRAKVLADMDRAIAEIEESGD